MLSLRFISVVVAILLVAHAAHGYLHKNRFSSFCKSRSLRMSSPVTSAEDLQLTPVLNDYAERLRKVTDDKLRYQQLLFLAAKCPPMDEALKVDANKVPGCLSVVHVHATKDEENKIHYQADSDSQLTKGLVAMLVNGLSGHVAEDILRVKPEFIQYAGVGKSLTPGRNNGFLNMLNLMKLKAKQLSPEAAKAAEQTVVTDDTETVKVESDSSVTQSTTPAVVMEKDKPSENVSAAVSIDISEGGPVYQSIAKKLSMLQPVQLNIEDESYKHAGHAGIAGSETGETHFTVSIVASCFAGLSRVQRHQMIYTLLGQEMKEGVHALSINAKTPDEVQ